MIGGFKSVILWVRKRSRASESTERNYGLAAEIDGLQQASDGKGISAEPDGISQEYDIVGTDVMGERTQLRKGALASLLVGAGDGLLIASVIGLHEGYLLDVGAEQVAELLRDRLVVEVCE